MLSIFLRPPTLPHPVWGMEEKSAAFLRFSEPGICPGFPSRFGLPTPAASAGLTFPNSKAWPGANGEGFWPDAIDTDKSATPTLAAKAMPTEPGLTWGFISDPEGPAKREYMSWR